ncbi:uncharacterized protein PG986_004573 [Apiospora aurea]|uniref:2EXR domain-containing protein n=1 Tax=Apiospora aurea TaxID=335848 RepID=A0ABR1QMZ0_9PEZI
MAGAADFSLFPELPTEIRLLIWEQAVLEEYRDRILMRPFRPVFHASRESREVANALFPVRLPVHVFANRAARWHEAAHPELALPPSSPIDSGRAPVGEIPVGLEHDTFLFGMSWWYLRSFQPAVAAAKLAGQPPPRFANLRSVYDSRTCKPVEVEDPRKGFVGAFVTAELARPLVHAIRNVVAVVHGAPREDGQTTPCTAGARNWFRKAPTYRRLHLADEDSFRALGD